MAAQYPMRIPRRTVLGAGASLAALGAIGGLRPQGAAALGTGQQTGELVTFATVRARRYEQVIGTYDPADPVISRYLKAVDGIARQHRDSMDRRTASFSLDRRTGGNE